MSGREDGKLTLDKTLVVSSGAGKELAARKALLADWVKAGGHVLAMGIGEEEASELPLNLVLKKAEHISTWFEPFGMTSVFAGVSPAELHNRDPRELPLVASGQVVGHGVLARAEDANVVVCQLAP